MISLSCTWSVYFQHLNETEITCDCSFAASSSHCRSYCIGKMSGKNTKTIDISKDGHSESYPKTMSSPYLMGSLSSGKTPSWGCELEPRGGEGWLLLQDGRSSRDGGGHSASELPSKTMPTGHNWGSLLG